MKILIIEDEPALLETVLRFLESEKYIVETATDFKSGMHKIGDYDYDCILLDIMLPNGSGIDILKEIRRMNKKDAVIILSAKDAVEDKVLGLDLGADDYLAKPFNLLELHSRIKSVIRSRHQGGKNSIDFKNVSLFPEERSVFVDGKALLLNRKEYDLLYYFMIRPEKTLQKTTLAEAVWGDNIDQADSLDFIYSQIKNLRKKLKESKAEVDFQAVYGIGYKLV
ncbi:Response regulator ArlR [Capnocytophaga canimorsus]|uniref:Response regulator ArlR n=1 Tax=Capnocytophaga canimorsus TaxID=28188 RepID=A0A0B7H6B0_9FLAO|nr:response regulator transcription factor [Capnocytophaga canimorsus]ATA76460.1 DNA-binding response regulator [Capnocytophaga canimorsus]PJI76017.1 DNA-binding response OmpR family regulator [Capnocytophaga canimorsus]CEN33467.1 Response regulator ArlR [Capnocytophaga canimorsus]STA71609.1 Phosphate regulon transcriptional regulatory protein phoB [Capnocytophaga canimorsus]